MRKLYIVFAAALGFMAVAVPAAAHHGTNHLPPAQVNVDLVSELQVSNIAAERVADVATYRDTAFLAGWSPMCTLAPNFAGGFWSIDIADPNTPRELGFTPMDRGSYLTEGMHAMRLTVPTFTGDVLVASREPCGNAGAAGKGGFVIYDVTNAGAPVRLSEAGDRGVRANFNSSHSAFGWDTGDKAYVAIVDNNEVSDIDIFDITDPRNPVLIKEVGIDDWPAAQDNLAFGSEAFVHDLIVRRVEGQWLMLASYWDVGYVVLNVDNPANPVYVKDSDYPAVDPEMGAPITPEGNGHEAEWDRCPEEGVRSTFPCGDVRYILAADEDFSVARPTVEQLAGTGAGPQPAGEFSFTPPLSSMFPNGVTGPTVWGGTGCPTDVNGNGTPDRAEVPLASTIPVAAGETAVVVFTRGECFFSDKIATGEQTGYRVVVIGNHHSGASGGLFPDAFICGGQGSPIAGTSAALCIGHRTMHQLFNDAVTFTPVNDPTFVSDFPAVGTIGNRIRARGGVFDGWGYLHLLNADTMAHIDSYAVPESIDPRFAQGFGDLTIHEITTDPTGDVGYAVWYSAGFRVIDYSGGDLVEVGKYIAPRGSDMWGVELNVRADGRLYELVSDRSFGLQIFRFGTDLRPTKISSPRRTRVGNTFSYRIGVRNNGTIAETATVVRDRLPRGVRFVSASATQGRCSYRAATRTVVCNLGRLVNDAQGAFVTIRVRALRTGLLRNVARIQGRKAEYDIGNNTARATTRVLRARVAAPAGGRLTGGR